MAVVRALIKVFLLIVWFTFCASVIIIRALFKDKLAARKVAAGVMGFWARGSAAILGIKIKVKGDIDGFKGGLIVSNHLGYLDILIEGAVFPIVFTPKNDIRSWPVLGRFVNLSRPIWVDRAARQQTRQVVKECEITLQNELALLMYPEGTSTNGDSILEFKSTPFEVAINTGGKVRPVLVHYSDGHQFGWYDDEVLLAHIWRILKTAGFEAVVTVLPEESVRPGEDRKAFAKRIHDLMLNAYQEEKI